MERIALIMGRAQSDWVSCQSISKNLLAAYQMAFKKEDIKIFDYSFTLRDDQIDLLAMEIVSYFPDKIVFLDHYPHIGKLAIAMKKKYLGPERPSLFIHVYGDFTLFLKEWLGLEYLLKNHKIRFFCASDKQLSLIKKLLKSPEHSVSKCPFPVNGEVFFHDPQIRDPVRKGLGLKENQMAFLYTGRMSYQKNILSLVKDFATFLEKTSFDTYLYLAGKFDDIGKTFLGHYFFKEEFFYWYQLAIKELPASFRKRIIFLGNLSQSELKEVYNACDYYLNLSVHNDEDYGMAPAEALCCGLPCILTDWGGFSSFAKIGLSPQGACELVPVHILEKVISYEKNFFIKMISNKTIDMWTESKRSKLSKLFLKRLSIPGVQAQIKDIHGLDLEKFKGFSSMMEDLVIQSKLKNALPFNTSSVEYNEKYKELYDSYES